MATNRVEAVADAAEATAAKADETASAGTETPKAGGGFMAWLPLIVTVVTMPVLAYATTTFVLLPKVQKSLNNGAPAASTAEKTTSPGAETVKHAATVEAAPSSKGKGDKSVKTSVPISKILVNLSGSMGTRYLLASLSLVGETPDFKDIIEKNQSQLVDLAAGILSTKTINDLEQPGARNTVRNELVTVFNNTLGNGTVKEIYLTEFAVQ